MFLLDIVQALESSGVPYVLVGGYALALQGIVRATVDVDFVVSLKEKDLIAAERALNGLGLTSRIPVRAVDMARFHQEYRSEKNLVAWSFVDPRDPTRQVDLLIHPPLKTVKTQLVSIHGTKIRVATKASLLDMKRLANRPEDQLDIQKLEKAMGDEK